MISTASDLIDKLGGNKPVGDLLGVQDNTVSTWRVRGFPAWACARLREKAEAEALPFADELFEIKARSKADSAPELRQAS